MLSRLALSVAQVLLVVTLGTGGPFPQHPAHSHSGATRLAAEPPNITAETAIVLDETTRQILYAKSAHKRVAPASLTKMVTAIVAVERGKLTDRVTVDVDSEELVAETASSVMGLMPGDELTLEDLLYGLLLPSGNDAAIAIARHIAGSEDDFVELMNRKVREMRLRDSRFANSHGLDADGHYSTAYDMAIIARSAMQHPQIARVVSTRKIKIRLSDSKVLDLYNGNPLIGEYWGVDGVKPGYTDEAQQAIAATAKRQKRRLFVVVIRSEALAKDATSLFDYYFPMPILFSPRHAVLFPPQTSPAGQG